MEKLYLSLSICCAGQNDVRFLFESKSGCCRSVFQIQVWSTISQPGTLSWILQMQVREEWRLNKLYLSWTVDLSSTHTPTYTHTRCRLLFLIFHLMSLKFRLSHPPYLSVSLMGVWTFCAWTEFLHFSFFFSLKHISGWWRYRLQHVFTLQHLTEPNTYKESCKY